MSASLPVDQDLALIRPVSPREDLHQGGFAGAVVADKPHDLAAPQLQIHALEGVDTTETLADALHFNDVFCTHAVTHCRGI